MGKLAEKLRAFSTNRWLVFVAAMWLQSMVGIGYLFGAISPVVKAALGYNQRQVAALGVAKNLGDCVGFLAGALSATVPAWGLLLIGAAHIFLGYGWLWLVVTRQAPALPLWMVWHQGHNALIAPVCRRISKVSPPNQPRCWKSPSNYLNLDQTDGMDQTTCDSEGEEMACELEERDNDEPTP